jgi:hypothetical protein
MRKFCLILCLGVLTSLFHAAVMSVEAWPAQAVQSQSSTGSAHAEHHCDELAANPTLPAFKCALGAHLCCLGLTATLTDAPGLVPSDRSRLMNPVVLSLVLQMRENKLFKPPKRALLA